MAFSAEPTVEWKNTSVDGMRVFYQDNGSKSGQTLLFIHGWGCDVSFWKRQIDAFSGQYRCIALDLPGFGQSDKPNNVAYTLGLFARAVKNVVDDSGASNIVLVGHSMGVAVARQYLVEHPDDAKAVVNVDGAVLFLPDDPTVMEAMAKEMAQAAQSYLGPEREKVLDEFVEGLFYGKTSEDIQKIVRRTMIAVDPYVGSSCMTEFFNSEWWKPQIFDLPCLALYAENPHGDPNVENNLRGEFPALIFELWTDTGHFLMMEKPERFNAALQKFLDAVP